MSTVYSLICFGGRTGKTVTFTDAGDVVNLTSHGLRPGTGVVFSTSGSLPTGLSAGTTYYAKQGADANKCLLYPTSADAIAGTNQVTFSGTGTGTHTVKGAYFSGLTSDQKARYGSAGSERIYDGLEAWNTGRSGASKLDIEVCEIGEAWDDWLANQVTINVPAGAIRVETKVNGVRSAGFHNGQISDGTTNYGYVARRTNYSDAAIVVSSVGTTLDGFTVMREAGGYGPTGITAGSFKMRTINMIVRSLSNSGIGINTPGVGSETINCLVMGWGDGFYLSGYSEGILIANCTAVKNSSRGFNCITYQPVYAYVYNCVALGNTTENWQATLSGLRYATNNAGGTGQAWMAGTGASRIEITEASPFTATFADYTNNDFTPKDASSQLVDAGAEYYGAYAYDIADDERPNYNNGGSEAYDVGAFEFDHGYGPHPATATISLVNIIPGTRVRITRDDTSAELYNDIPGSSLSFETSYIGAFSVVARKASATPFYREFMASGTTVADQTTSIKFLQQLDE